MEIRAMSNSWIVFWAVAAIVVVLGVAGLIIWQLARRDARREHTADAEFRDLAPKAMAAALRVELGGGTITATFPVLREREEKVGALGEEMRAAAELLRAQEFEAWEAEMVTLILPAYDWLRSPPPDPAIEDKAPLG